MRPRWCRGEHATTGADQTPEPRPITPTVQDMYTRLLSKNLDFRSPLLHCCGVVVGSLVSSCET